jgi:hypothetical protein
VTTAVILMESTKTPMKETTTMVDPRMDALAAATTSTTHDTM